MGPPRPMERDSGRGVAIQLPEEWPGGWLEEQPEGSPERRKEPRAGSRKMGSRWGRRRRERSGGPSTQLDHLDHPLSVARAPPCSGMGCVDEAD